MASPSPYRKATRKSEEDTVQIKSRLVAWRTRINALTNKTNGSITSKDFIFGKWCWFMECYKQLDINNFQGNNIVYFTLKTRDTQSSPIPIASLVVNVFFSRESPIITRVSKDVKIPYISSTKKKEPLRPNESLRWLVKLDLNTLDVTTPVTFGLEFIDLKFENRNDGKNYSIWNEEYSLHDTLNEPIRRMLSESIYTDIVINASDGSIGAHRAVLAANSPVFKTMFSGNYKEKETSTVNMDDMSLETCKAMLNFLYGERKSKELRAYNMSLMIAADKYDIVALKKACEATLCEDIGDNNVFEKLVYAHAKELPELKSTCMFYLVKMGKIYALRGKYDSFLLEANPELVVLVSNACLDML